MGHSRLIHQIHESQSIIVLLSSHHTQLFQMMLMKTFSSTNSQKVQPSKGSSHKFAVIKNVQ